MLSELTQAINDQDEEAALAALHAFSFEDELSPLTVAALLAFAAGARLAQSELPPTLRTSASAVNLLDESIQRYLREDGLRMVDDLSVGSRQAILDAIRNQIADGGSAREAAREIRNYIGLTVPQQNALENLRQAMLDDGATKEVIRRTLAQRADSMLDHRAGVIARTEAFAAVAQGRQSMWEQLEERGVLDPETNRKWITAEDELVCPICGPMHGQIVGLREPFVLAGRLAGLTTLTTPAHPVCRCSVILIRPKAP